MMAHHQLQLGFGVYKLRDPACTDACLAALAAGYRHIDSAQLYRNEHLVRDAVRRSGLARSSVFLATKVGAPVPRRARRAAAATGAEQNQSEEDHEDVYRSVVEAVARLAGEAPDDYVDLALIHVPGPSRTRREHLWKALERLQSEGKARAIGVSNFRVRHLEEMCEYASAWPPAVNQIELHPWCQQREVVDYCRTHGIAIQAYSPLATGARLDDATLKSVADGNSKSPAQVLIRYSLQKGWMPLPKSAQAQRIQENANVFDFVLDDEDMATLDALDEGAQGARFPVNAA